MSEFSTYKILSGPSADMSESCSFLLPEAKIYKTEHRGELFPQAMDFETWCAELDNLAKADWGLTESHTLATGTDFWREMYDDGLTPEEAWAEELAAAASVSG